CFPEARQGLCQFCEGEPSPGDAVTHQVRIVDLPVGATEDRLVGSLDIEQAIKSGAKSFEPGLIAAAHRGILYIDEVNLLNDHLVDVLLDAAAMGRNYVEREGISVSHAAQFILVGTMNPEEGDLRPQLLDRFGLAVEVDGALASEDRREVVRRRIEFEAEPHRFVQQWQEAEQAERERLLRSQELLGQVRVSDEILGLITDICFEYQVDGMRGDIVMYKTASTIAAYEGRTQVSVEDVREAAQMALLHRQRRQPFQQPHLVTEQLDSMLDEYQNRAQNREPHDQDSSSTEDGGDDSDPPDLDQADLDQPDPNPNPNLSQGRLIPARASNGSKPATLTRFNPSKYNSPIVVPAGPAAAEPPPSAIPRLDATPAPVSPWARCETWRWMPHCEPPLLTSRGAGLP
ncbi:MAG: ATP-binding protein, partial [Chloroflexi bacterium]|nr:ATP-binding protein [Chloroflexota bacterium]